MFGFFRPSQKPDGRAPAGAPPILPRKTAGALQLIPPSDLLRDHEALIKRIIQTMGLKSEDAWMVLEACEGIASYLQNLPYSRGGNHREEGGALRYALEVGFTAAQSTEGVIFSGLETAERRRDLEPAWRYATLLAALAADIHLPVMDRLIVGTVSHKTWQPMRASLWSWGSTNQDNEYFLQWRDTPGDPSAAISGYLLPHAIPLRCTEFVLTKSPVILTSMLSSIIGVRSESDVLSQTVQNARQSVKDRDSRAHADRPAFARAGTIEHQVVEIMRHLVEGRTWSVNEASAAVYFTDLGVLVRWSALRTDVPNMANQIGLVGIPFSDVGLTELLHASGLLSPFSEGTLIHTLDVLGKTDAFIRLSDEAYLFPTTHHYERLNIGTSTKASISGMGESGNQGIPMQSSQKAPTSTVKAPVHPEHEPASQAGGGPDQSSQDAKRLLDKLGLASRMLFQHIARDVGRPDVSQFIVKEIDGSCWIAADLITQYGFDHAPIFNELAAAGMLVTTDGRRNVKEKREIAGKKREAVLLRQEVCVAMLQTAEAQQ